MRRADDAQGGPIAGGRQGPGVTVGEDGGPIRDQPMSIRADRPVVLDILLSDLLCLPDERVNEFMAWEGFVLLSAPLHPVNGPCQVDGRGAGPAQHLAMARQLRIEFFEGGCPDRRE